MTYIYIYMYIIIPRSILRRISSVVRPSQRPQPHKSCSRRPTQAPRPLRGHVLCIMVWYGMRCYSMLQYVIVCVYMYVCR